MAQQSVNLASLELSTHIVLDPNRLDNGELATVRIQCAVPSLVGSGRTLCLMELDPEAGGPSREIARFQVDIVEKGEEFEFANVKRLDETEMGAGGGFVSTATVKELESRLNQGQKNIIAYQKASAKKKATAWAKEGEMANMSLDADTLPPPREQPYLKLQFEGCSEEFEVFIYLAEEDLVFELGIDLYVDQEIKFQSHDHYTLLDCSKEEDRGNLKDYEMYKRVYGASPEKVALLNDPLVSGLQAAGMIAIVKHFPGIGSTKGDTHHQAVVVDKSLGELKTCDLIPFQSAINAGAGAIMVGHAAYPQITGSEILPATLSREIVTGLLREKMGFQGLIIADELFAMEAVGNYMFETFQGPHPLDPQTPEDEEEYSKWHLEVVQDELCHRRTVAALSAGNDIFILFKRYQNSGDERTQLAGIIAAIQRATESGELPAAQLEASVRRILEAKYAFFGQKLFENFPGAGTVDTMLQKMTIEEKIAQTIQLEFKYGGDLGNYKELNIGGIWVGPHTWDQELKRGFKIPIMICAEDMSDYVRSRPMVGIRFDAAI